MTIVQVTLDRPDVGTGSSVICWFCPHGRFPPQSGFFGSQLPANNVAVPSARIHHFCVLRRWFFEDKNLLRPIFQIFHVSYQNISFPNSPTRLTHNQSRFLVIASCRIDEFSPDHSAPTDDIQPPLRKYYCPFDCLSKSSFIWRFPIFQEVVDISKRTAFHRIWPPPVILS